MSEERWAPFQAFASLEQEMHSLLDRVGARSWVDGFGWRPDTDIYRDDSGMVVQLELPGIDPLADLDVDACLLDAFLAREIAKHQPDPTQTDHQQAGAFAEQHSEPDRQEHRAYIEWMTQICVWSCDREGFILDEVSGAPAAQRQTE